MAKGLDAFPAVVLKANPGTRLLLRAQLKHQLESGWNRLHQIVDTYLGPFPMEYRGQTETRTLNPMTWSGSASCWQRLS